MRLFDTHAHYDDPRFDEDRDAVLSALTGEGVAYVTNVGTDLETSRATLALTRRYPHVYGAVGYHPHEAKSLTDEGLDEVVRMLSEPKIAALHAGLECGILSGKMPDLDCISIGPDLTNIHTPRERLHIASTERTWYLTLETLKRLK